MSLTLFEQVTDWRYYQQRKHDLPEGSVEGEINKMSQFDFLKEISEALEQLQEQKDHYVRDSS